ncbi:hypothetical protein [Helicobacter pylori]|uniref:hypothetical protein n=1 Tax=Helicobacter pylori TaxID=210 RepID=UPI0002BB1556|nr:hypothetical protein [Helicobacter pylori]EMH02203.1 hypothetical protein HMPREF1405_00325 [Helicobacter pylori GAM231Ai]
MKIKLTLKTPLKTPYQGNKVTTIGALFTKKKKTGFHRGLALIFGGFLKTLFGISKFFNVKSRQRK